MKKIGVLLLTVLFCAGCRGGSGEEAAAFTEPISISEESFSAGSAAPVVTASAETEVVSTTAPEPSTEASSISSNSKEPDPIETQDDFSDIVELTYEQIMERFDQIAERAFHTEIKNDMEMKEIISHLMDRYIICTNTYVLSYLFDLATDENGSRITITDQDQNIYHKIQFRYFNTLAEMENFTKNTFTQSRAELYVSSSSSMDVYIPMFIENEDGIYYCMPSYFISPSPAFYDDYIVEIKEQSETECVFSYSANVDPKRYNQMLEAEGRMVWAESDFYHEGKIVLENGKWKVDYVSPAAF